MKPSHEPVVVARKPLVGTVGQNVLAFGTGAINVDGCRIGTETMTEGRMVQGDGSGIYRANSSDAKPGGWRSKPVVDPAQHTGRWPANVALDSNSAAALDQQSGTLKDGVAVKRNGGGAASPDHVLAGGWQSTGVDVGYDGGGGASRFFYVAKAPKSERPVVDGVAHPTVKPLALMRWLVRLVTPPGGLVLDPFAGSGTTVEAAILEGFNVIAIEREADYLALIQARIFRAKAAVEAAQFTPCAPPSLFDDNDEVA